MAQASGAFRRECTTAAAHASPRTTAATSSTRAASSGRPSFGPYPVEAGLLLAEAGGRRLFILAPKTGKVVWTWNLPTGTLLNAPAVLPRQAALLAWDEAATPVLYTAALPEEKKVGR